VGGERKKKTSGLKHFKNKKVASIARNVMTATYQKKKTKGKSGGDRNIKKTGARRLKMACARIGQSHDNIRGGDRSKKPGEEKNWKEMPNNTTGGGGGSALNE